VSVCLTCISDFRVRICIAHVHVNMCACVLVRMPPFVYVRMCACCLMLRIAASRSQNTEAGCDFSTPVFVMKRWGGKRGGGIRVRVIGCHTRTCKKMGACV